MFISSKADFSLINFSEGQDSKVRRVAIAAGTYELTESMHPDPKWNGSVPVLCLKGFPHLGAARNWWLFEIEQRHISQVATA